jgi:chromosomal replication initiator protein
LSSFVELAGSTANAHNHWKNALTVLRGRGQSYAVQQLVPLEPVAFAAGVLTLGVRDLFMRDWVDEHFRGLMKDALSQVTGAPVEISYEEIKGAPSPSALHAGPPVNQIRQTSRLNERFTFDSYVVSDSNQLPHAAAMAVADSPGRSYNPLFIYGETGLGKTHLLHAIGNRIVARNALARVVYLSTEDFTNQFIESVRDHRMTDFRRRFRDDCDVLLIDDIQFLGAKQETQNEFFHTFNALHQMSRAVVMTSDTVPSEIPGLEDRLRSRFAMGLTTDVNEPNYEARIAILKKKASDDGVCLTDRVAHFIAKHVLHNVRELEGALIKVTAVHALTGQPLTEELCAQVLKDILPKAQALDADCIQREVARYFRIPVDDLKGERRVKHVAHARQVAMYLCRTLTAASLPEIGKKFNKDHSTVLTSVRKIATLKSSDEQLKLELGELAQKLGPV